jgi:TPR repeat protein
MIQRIFIALLLAYSNSSIAIEPQKIDITPYSEITSNSDSELKYSYARLLLKDFKLKDAQKWMESAAKDGHTIAQGEVGSMYITGNLLNLISEYTVSGTLKIDNTLINFDKNKLVSGVNSANNWIDNTRRANESFNFDLDKGVNYLNLSYKKGNHLAKISCDGLIKLLINSSKTRNKYIEKLGMMYARGTCVEKDYDKSIVWFNKLAIKGVIKAYAYLGNTYYEKFNKYGEKNDLENALFFTNKAIESYSKSQPSNKNMIKYLINNLNKMKKTLERAAKL